MYGNCVITPYLLMALSVWKCVVNITCGTREKQFSKNRSSRSSGVSVNY